MFNIILFSSIERAISERTYNNKYNTVTEVMTHITCVSMEDLLGNHGCLQQMKCKLCYPHMRLNYPMTELDTHGFDDCNIQETTIKRKEYFYARNIICSPNTSTLDD